MHPETNKQRQRWIADEVERLREIERHRRRRFAQFSWQWGTFWLVALFVVAFGLWQLFLLAVGLLLRYMFPDGIG